MTQRSELLWEAPVVYPASELGPDAIDGMVAAGAVREVIDPIEGLADDIIDLRFPNRLGDEAFRATERRQFLENADSFGNFVLFPWDGKLVRYPDEPLLRDLTTFRNRYLVTADEQAALSGTTLAHFGLSVGSNIARSLVQAGIGHHYVLADRDHISPTNLNRISATMEDVGLLKTTWLGRAASKSNAYLNQTHLPEGYTDDTDILLGDTPIDLIVEEVDDLSVKAKLRRLAKQRQIPLVMVGDVGDTVVFDIERHDQEDVRPFNGKVSHTLYEDLLGGEVSLKDRETALLRLNGGLRTISLRLIDSAIRRGIDVAGFPQLGSTATAGAALATVAVREILLGRPLRSGTYVLPIRKVIGAASPTTFAQGRRILGDFVKYRRT